MVVVVDVASERVVSFRFVSLFVFCWVSFDFVLFLVGFFILFLGFFFCCCSCCIVLIVTPMTRCVGGVPLSLTAARETVSTFKDALIAVINLIDPPPSRPRFIRFSSVFFFKYFCTPIYCVSPRWTRLDRVLLGFYRFYLVLLGFTGFYWVLLGFTWCYLVLPSFNLVLPRFYLGFTGF